MDARGLIAGLTRFSNKGHIARAALESVAYQTADLVAAMEADGAAHLAALRVDGGMAANDWFCQFLADILSITVERPDDLETTARGAAMLAGHASGAWPGLLGARAPQIAITCFKPTMAEKQRRQLTAEWQAAIRRALII